MKLSFDEEYRRAMNELGECPLAFSMLPCPHSARLLGLLQALDRLSGPMVLELRGQGSGQEAKSKGERSNLIHRIRAMGWLRRWQPFEVLGLGSITTSSLKLETWKKETPKAKNLINVLSFTLVITK